MAEEKEESAGHGGGGCCRGGGGGCGGPGSCGRCVGSKFLIGFLLGILLTLGGFGLISIGRHMGRGCRMCRMPPPMARPMSAMPMPPDGR